MNILEITDKVAQMQLSDQEVCFLEERGIVIHIIKDNPEFTKKEKESKIYSAMGNTNWGRMAFDNQFAYNDFSSIGRTSLKGYKPICSVSYKTDNYYIYIREGKYYMTHSKHDKVSEVYNLNKENDQKLFYLNYIYDLREATIEGNMLYETYTMYDIIMNFKKFFQV